jgi:hypothetical protein
VAKKTTTDEAPSGIDRIGRALGLAAVSVALLGVVCILLEVFGSVSGASNSKSGLWPTINLLPLLAFPIAVLLILAFLIVNIVRLRRQNRGDTR